MTDLTCTKARLAAAEYALDILEPEERSALAAHLLRCPACRAEVDAMSDVATRLVELVPGTEPPLGFDRRVLARVRDISPASPARRFRRLRSRRSRLAAGVAGLAAAAALIFGSLGWFMGHSDDSSSAPYAESPQRVITDAAFQQGGRDVGEVYVYRANPNWLTMMVHGVQGGPRVTCEVVTADGRLMRVGSFDLVDGMGTWGAPDPAGLAGVTGARLTDSHGRLLATATFHT
jgi:hypothetical protein